MPDSLNREDLSMSTGEFYRRSLKHFIDEDGGLLLLSLGVFIDEKRGGSDYLVQMALSMRIGRFDLIIEVLLLSLA